MRFKFIKRWSSRKERDQGLPVVAVGPRANSGYNEYGGVYPLTEFRDEEEAARWLDQDVSKTDRPQWEFYRKIEQSELLARLAKEAA